MGKIIRNGIEFCGTSDTADNIIYDNKDSGLESTTTQGAIDELSEKVKTGGNVVYLTQEQYDNLPDSKLTDNVEYRVTDAGTMAGAENVGYDNSKSGLAAVNVQDAIDKLDESLDIFKITNEVKLAELTATGQTYTIQEDCLISISMYYASAKNGVQDVIRLNTCTVLYNNLSVNYFNNTSQPIRCFKGDVISVQNLTADSCYIYKISN